MKKINFWLARDKLQIIFKSCCIRIFNKSTDYKERMLKNESINYR